jgi:hypothetical protein
MRPFITIVAFAALVWGMRVAERSAAVMVYKQGQYQGKPDTQPWDNDQFKGDKVAWEAAIKKRNEAQNEYSRGTPTAN